MKDFGIGISDEDMKNLFNPFFRSTNSTNLEQNKMGNGLGLSICQNILKYLNGGITVESKLGEGSTFTIVLNTVKQS